jgi:hypothetical protein
MPAINSPLSADLALHQQALKTVVAAGQELFGRLTDRIRAKEIRPNETHFRLVKQLTAKALEHDRIPHGIGHRHGFRPVSDYGFGHDREALLPQDLFGLVFVKRSVGSGEGLSKDVRNFHDHFQ